MKIIGIDPGIGGAVAMIGETASVFDIPTTPHCLSGKSRQMVNLRKLVELLQTCGKAEVFCEEVGPMPWDTPLTAWQFSDSYRAVRDAVDVAGYPVTFVKPVIWRRNAGLSSVSSKLPKAEQTVLRKNQSRERALQLFPALIDQLYAESSHNRADALLIAWYGKEKGL
ncbi:MAG: hypothetical protein LBQ54_07600 [Planctomycetaceae bacterium]|jgi:crossover junction endodeoxyribonuclease RuvC|nr:hypothetical protein [Planctomycetaceae bacterium]